MTFAQDNQHLLSGGDDATVRLWDIASGAQVTRLDGHSDYVRALAVSPSSHDVWATGGQVWTVPTLNFWTKIFQFLSNFSILFFRYDHVCKIWDARTQGSSISMNHGAPIESLAFFPSGKTSESFDSRYTHLFIHYSYKFILIMLQSPCWSQLEGHICAAGISTVAGGCCISLLLIRRL